MHTAAVTNHHCIVYLGLGSPGGFFLAQSMGRELRLFVKKSIRYGWVGVWMGGTFPFFSFSIPSREIGSHDTLCYTVR